MSLTTTTPTPLTDSIATYSIDTAEFVSQLYISVPIGVMLIFFYCIVRKYYPKTWEVRRKYAEILILDDEFDDDNDNDNRSHNNANSKSDFDLPNTTKPITYPRISSGFIFWIYDVWMMDTNTFFKHAGFDALVFRLYLKGCFYICVASLPYALCVLLPVYGTSENANSQSDLLSILSLNTVGVDSNRLYAAVIGSYVFTFIALYYLSRVYLAIAYATDQFLIGSTNLNDIDKLSWFNYKEMINNSVDFSVNLAKAPMGFVGDVYSKGKRLIDKEHAHVRKQSSELELKNIDANLNNDNNKIVDIVNNDNDLLEEKTELLSDNEYNSDDVRELKHQIPEIDRYSIMIRDLPPQFRDAERLKQFFNRLFPSMIASVVIIPDVRELTLIQSQIKYHSKELRKLSRKYKFDLRDVYDDNLMPDVFEGRKCCGCCGEQINLITFHRRNKDALISKFNKLKKKGLDSTPTAFVIFKSLTTASICISCPIRFGLSNLKIEKAPYPNDLYWDNLKFKTTDLIPYNLLVMVAMFFLLIFWSIPVAAIQGLANLEKIFAAFGGDVNEYLNPTTVEWLQGSLSVLVLDLWLQLIPVVVELLTKIQRKPYRGRQEMLILTKYYDCLVFMVLLVTVVIGTTVSNAENFADYAKNIVNSLNTLVNQLAQGLSNMSVYFLLYVLLNTFIWLPLELYRPSYQFASRFGLNEANRFNYSIWFAKTMLILTILLTYSVMNPIMWILGLVYFMFATFVFTYNLSMSWVPEFETGAKQWPLIFGRLRFGFMISIVTLIGLMALKQAYICAALLVPLAGFVWYITDNLNMKFRPVFRAASLTSARDKDTLITKLINKGRVNDVTHLGNTKQINDSYLPPIMCIDYKTQNHQRKSSKSDINSDNNNNNNNNIANNLSYQNDLQSVSR